jgi:hypothetical protein
LAVVLALGGITFVTVRDDPPPPTTTTTTTTARPPTTDEVVTAIATALGDGLDVSLDEMQATCVAGQLVTVFGAARLQALADAGNANVDELTRKQRDALVHAVVDCVPPQVAEELLSTKPPPPADETLPADGTAP